MLGLFHYLVCSVWELGTSDYGWVKRAFLVQGISFPIKNLCAIRAVGSFVFVCIIYIFLTALIDLALGCKYKNYVSCQFVNTFCWWWLRCMYTS